MIQGWGGRREGDVSKGERYTRDRRGGYEGNNGGNSSFVWDKRVILWGRTYPWGKPPI